MPKDNPATNMLSELIFGPRQTIDKLKALVREESEKLTASAGGRIESSSLAMLLAEQVKFYEYGQSDIIPPEWESYRAKLDPEWDEYQRLRAKFEGR